jgi:hypothetical protein
VDSQTVTPRGYAATAAELLNVSAEDTGPRYLVVRQLAAMQATGYALLAIADQLADLTDASTDLSERLAEIADGVDALAEILDGPAAAPRRLFAPFRRLARIRRGGAR